MKRRSETTLCGRAALSVLLLTACTTSATDEEALLPSGAPLGIETTPLLVVGERADDPVHEFFRVLTPFLLPGGALAVPLAAENTVRIFNPDGSFERSVGARGEGPGEFMGLSSAWGEGDTVAAVDNQLGRVTRFVPGEPPATTLLEAVPSAQSGAPGLSDGSAVMFGVREVPPDRRDRIAVHRFHRDGSHAGAVQETVGFRRADTGPDPISPRPIVRTRGTRVYVAETLTPRITEIDALTGAHHVVEWTPGDVPSSEEAIRAAREAVVGAGLSEDQLAWMLSGFDALRGDEAVSVFWDFLVDSNDFFWIRDYDPRVHAAAVGGLAGPGPGGTWTVIDREGRLVTTVALPDDFEPRAIESDHLIGVRRDALDVESVRVYRIERAGH